MSLPRITEILETFAMVSHTPAEVITSNTYGDVCWLDTAGKGHVVFTLYNDHAANGIHWKILASIDNATWVEMEAETDLAAKATASWVAEEAEAVYRHFKVQVQSGAPDTPGKALVAGYSKL